jgi:hypothetical protein
MKEIITSKPLEKSPPTNKLADLAKKKVKQIKQ